ncbi:DUF2752 domain-containing protein [Streptomyces collinus]|uniref:DUF2752 domain-containing protein n=1 Tax=Streptomyces collinus TaxID=42684 RepID=UPI00367AB527
MDPTRAGRFPACPFRTVTGFDWCGSQRALHELTHGHLAAAADYNLLTGSPRGRPGATRPRGGPDPAVAAGAPHPLRR